MIKVLNKATPEPLQPYPGSYHVRIRTTDMLARLVEEVKWRTRVVEVFPNDRSAATLATEIALRSSEQWTIKRYLTLDALEAVENRTHNFRDIDREECRKYTLSIVHLHWEQRQVVCTGCWQVQN